MTEHITVSRELLRQAFDALREIAWSNDSKWQSDRAQAMTEPLRTALEQPAVEPVAELTGVDEYGPLLGWHTHWAQFPIGTELYTDAPVPSSELVSERTG